MSALQVEAPPREPLTVSRPGKVLEWQIAVGDRVQRGQNIALFDDGKGGAIQITAPCSGRVATLLRAGLPVAANAAIAQLEPDQRAEPVKRALPIAAPQCTPPAPKASPALSGEVLEAIAELSAPAIVEAPPIPPPVAKARKPERERVKNRGYYILPSQERAITRLAAELSTDEAEPLKCNDSELVRAAIDNLLSMSPLAIRAMVKDFKARESQAGVGAGWPRPKRSKRSS